MNLTELLERATDQVASPGLASPALTAAARRHAHRRVLIASAAVAAIVVGTGSIVASQSGDQPPNPSRTPTPGDTTPPVEESHSAFDPNEQPLWDPLTLGEASARDSLLPARLEPPVNPPSIARLPMEAAVIAWPQEGEDVRLLGTDGEWRCIEGTADAAGSTWWYSNPALSSDGTRVAMSSEDGVVVADVTTGEQEVIPWPDALHAPWDTAPEVRWLPDNTGLAVFYWNGNWVVDLDGNWREAPFARGYSTSVAIDHDGPIIAHNWRTSELVEWDGDEVARRVPFPYQGERFASGYGRIAFTTGNPGDVAGGATTGSAPVVVDGATGELLAFRPIRDPYATYSDNGHLTALGFLDADTVLYLVGPAEYVDRRLVVDAWHLAAWDVETGEFERLATGPEGMRMIDVAVGVLAGG